jgi:hypothetical protein
MGCHWSLTAGGEVAVEPSERFDCDRDCGYARDCGHDRVH